MEFSIFFQTPEILFEPNVGYAYGYFTLKNKDCEISFFKERNCMIFLTLTMLLDDIAKNLTNNNFSIKWVGDGNGKVFYLRRKGKVIEFKDELFEINLDFNIFWQETLRASEDFYENCLNKNPDVLEEVAFTDFKSVLKKIRS